MRNTKTLSDNIRYITIPLHIIGVFSFFYLFLSGEWSRLWVAVLFWILFSGLGIAIGYHRLLSHHAFESSVFCKRLLAFLGVFAGQGSPVFWTATHRGLHHPFSDQDLDPHSPKKGLFHSFLGWQFYFDRHRFSPRYALDIIRDSFLKQISIHYHKVYWSGVAIVFSADWKLGLGSLIPAMILSCHQENIVNSLCHLKSLGYRNFDISDNSTNIWILGVLFWGQALHNNHHRYPKRWNYAIHWWELDPCALIIPLIRRSPKGADTLTVGVIDQDEYLAL